MLGASSEGIDKISEMFIGLKKESDFVVQFAHSGVIKLHGDKATARWVMHEVSKGPGKAYHQNYGLYMDVMKKTKRQVVVYTARLPLPVGERFTFYRKCICRAR